MLLQSISQLFMNKSHFAQVLKNNSWIVNVFIAFAFKYSDAFV